MNIALPKIIQGGMGAGVSGWRLAQAVSRLGQLGVVSGTGLAEVVARRLQDGDPGGHVRRALAHFPFPQMAQRVMDGFFISGGRTKNMPYKRIPMFEIQARREPLELSIIGNFAEVFLAREGHDHPVGINYLEKMQLPHLSSIYGALLAGVSVVIMGAGIPLAVPQVLRTLARHETATYPISVVGADGKNEMVDMVFNPQDFIEGTAPPDLQVPYFFPIVSSDSLASILLRKASGPIDGFIVEGNLAGGHNAPPRGRATFNEAGEPIYGKRDEARLSAFRENGLPFWLAGSVGSPEGLQLALEEGASGIQVGTAFALCAESGLLPEVRHQLISKALQGQAEIVTDPRVSPTGFPFKVAHLENSLSEKSVYEKRERLCDLGFLRQPYRRKDGSLGYRCPAEPVAAYLAKGGSKEDTVGRKCLCNALIANVGMPQLLPDGSTEKCLITLGDDLLGVERFCKNGTVEFSAEEVVQVLLGS